MRSGELLGPFAVIFAACAVLLAADASTGLVLALGFVSALAGAVLAVVVGSVRGPFARGAVVCVAACVGGAMMLGLLSSVVMRTAGGPVLLARALVPAVAAAIAIPLTLPLLLVSHAAWSGSAREHTVVHAAEARTRWRIVAASLAVAAVFRPPSTGRSLFGWPPTHLAAAAAVLAALLVLTERDARRSIVDPTTAEGFVAIDAIPHGALVVDHGVGDAAWAKSGDEITYRASGGVLVVLGDAERARVLVTAKLRASIAWLVAACLVVAWHAFAASS